MATIVTTIFRRLGEMESKYLGMPQLPLVIVPHPVGGQPEARVKQIAKGALPLIEEVLLTPADVLTKRKAETTK